MANGVSYNSAGRDTDSYIEFETSGYILINQNSLPPQVADVQHVIDNVYRIYMNTWEESEFRWNIPFAHIGSPTMRPEIRWSQVCNAENNQLDLTPFAATDCTFIPKYRWQLTDRVVSDDGTTETETNTFTVLFDEGMVF